METFQSDIATTLGDIADKTIKKAGKSIPSLKSKDKIDIVRQLDSQGFFLIKGSVKLIAEKLKASQFSIYNYLNKIRGSNSETEE